MTPTDDERPRTKITDQTYVASFGRYQAGGEAEPPADEVLVGRKSQRALFIDLLLRGGRRGSYLITGHRGVGKTSFVRYCLSEYKAEVFERFLRSNVGRSIFWDRFLVLGLWLVILFLALMASELMDLLIHFVTPDDSVIPENPSHFFIWFLVFILALPCLYPLLLAREIAGEIIEASSNRKTRERINAALATAVTLGLALLCWYRGPFGDPVLSLSRALLALGALYLWLQSTSFEGEDGSRWNLLFRPALNLLALGLLGAYFFWPLGMPAAGSSSETLGNAVLAIGLIGVGGILCGLGKFHARRSQQAEATTRLARPPALRPLLTLWDLLRRWCMERINRAGDWKRAVASGGPQKPAAATASPARHSPPPRVRSDFDNSGAFWYLFPGGILAGTAFWYLGSQGPSWLFWSGLVGAVTLALAGLHLIGTGREYTPRPCFVLGAKAVLCVVVCLHLVFPILSWISLDHEKLMPFGRLFDLVAEQAEQADTPRTLHLKAEQIQEFQSRERQRMRMGAARLSPVSLFEPSYAAGTDSSGRQEQFLYVILLFLCGGVIYFLEYECIVRPFLRHRSDRVINPTAEAVTARRASGYRDLARLTLPWLLYKMWLPVLTVAVNLGFERLDHRRVVQAMLTGLRNQYHGAFLAWNSGVANLGRLLRLVVLLMIVVWAGEKFFKLPPVLHVSPGQFSDWSNYKDICGLFEGNSKDTGLVGLICKLRYGSSIVHVLYHDFVGTKPKEYYTASSEHILFYVFPFNEEDWPAGVQFQQPVAPVGSIDSFVQQGPHFRVYHLLLFLALLLLGRWITRRLPVPAYRNVLRQIDGMIDSLTAVTSVTSRVGRWQPVQWLEGLFLNEKVRQIQQDPFDPRTIEFLFLNILEEMQETAIRLPGARSQVLNLPMPEVTFFFDELDKLGTRLDPIGEGESLGTEQQREILHAERRRSLELHRLLADLKNLLSTAPARFIFVGGRNLHDEWLADQTSRQPLLTNIFSAEIYLPSLLTDHDQRSAAAFEENVRYFLEAQVHRAKLLCDRFARKLALPSLALSLEEAGAESFPRGGAHEDSEGKLEIVRIDEKGKPEPQEHLDSDFVKFLAYRSRGNPKRLRELLSTFVHPLGRVVENEEERKAFFCEHVLRFDETDRFRIQLVSALYRNLATAFERGFANRDDKMTLSMFHLADFLLKFHRRAFSWSNLERVEDLVHIHRAPDLRQLLEGIVEQWSDRFLHPLLNGMYDFRFRSGFALELQHISRQSPEEMAAFNFTLDESQILKSVYEANIRRLKEEKGQELQDIVAGLGELHEFDQEYETARFYYRRAITLLDNELREITGGSLVLEKSSPMIQVMGGKEAGEENARLFMSWGIARLRLMLQIGMTFELAKNFERAEVEYQNARTLARSLLLAMLGTEPDTDPSEANINAWTIRNDRRRLHALKHLNLLFQPAFAEAWLAEKFGAGVDTSIGLIEKELHELRKLLPFVQAMVPEISQGAFHRRHANFSLIIAELHNKAGDLYFFKGRQIMEWSDMKAVEQEMQDRASGKLAVGERKDGYLLRAHHHYSVSLHELRRFTTYRLLSSRNKLNIWTPGLATQGKGPKRPWKTLSSGSWPDFVYRSAGETFNDLSEAMIGRVSLFGLHVEMKARMDRQQNVPPVEPQREPESQRNRIRELAAKCTKWMESAEVGDPQASLDEPSPGSSSADGIEIVLHGDTLKVGGLDGWLGIWNSPSRQAARGRDATAALVEFGEWDFHGDMARLAVALDFMQVGAKYLQKGGYIEDSAREYLKIAETVAGYLWWCLMFRRAVLEAPGSKLEEPSGVGQRLTWRTGVRLGRKYCEAEAVVKHGYWRFLLEVGTYALEKVDRLFHQGRKIESEGAYLVTDKVPAVAVTLACSLGLLTCCYDAEFSEERKLLRELLSGWRGHGVREGDGKEDFFLRTLEDSLARHSFPVMNRLQGLKVLVDAALLRRDTQRSAEDAAEEYIARTEELLDLAGMVDAPLHFTPLQTGTTCALVYLCCRRSIPEVKDDKQDRKRASLLRIRAAAQRDLFSSEQMATMRRDFYGNVSNLYYLYDDFNDRHLHFQHAMQMAGIELASLLRALVEDLGLGQEAAQEPAAAGRPELAATTQKKAAGRGQSARGARRKGKR